MKIQQIDTTYTRIADSLDTGALKPAFDSIQGLIAGTGLYSFQNKLNELQETYQYMLRYFAEGTKDPMQDQIYASIRTGSYELTDQIRHEALIAESPEAYYAVKRTIDIQSIDIKELIDDSQSQYELEDFVNYENSVSQLFAKIWTTAFLSEKNTNPIRKSLKSKTFPSAAKCQIVSALLLGLQISFDKEKLYLLFDAANLKDEEVRIRALIAICLTLYTYRKRTFFYPGIQHRLDSLAETPDFKRIMNTIIIRFILSRETEKVTHKLQEEIIPAMMKLAPKINPNINLTDSSEPGADDMNPEWKNILADSKLTKKLEEYNQMQEEGVDVMHSTFIHLKHFPFFRNISNWFLPFTLKHSAFKGIETFGSALETILQASFMCNSDKYSLYFSIFQIPEEHRKAMINQMDSQLNEMNKQVGEELKSKHNKVENIVGQYIQDLYRFYKLFPRHTDFDDIFNWTLDFHRLPILSPYFSDAETLINIAEFYLRKGYFDNAQDIYQQLVAESTHDEMLYQKLGYCKQMNGDFTGALDEYLRSEILNPDSKWLTRRIANCYRTLKQPEKALQYYLRYDQLNPDNASILINVGHCYMEIKNYNEALKYYFKADYLEPDSHKAWRPIAWCSFLAGKYDQARNYYKKILENQPQTQDYLNAGHTEWSLQNIKKALIYYKAAIQSESGNFNKFHELFEEDIPDLILVGIEPSEIDLLLDQLRYSI
jgi:tetratricopeptide (TPR) repeat protein